MSVSYMALGSCQTPDKNYTFFLKGLPSHKHKSKGEGFAKSVLKRALALTQVQGKALGNGHDHFTKIGLHTL